MHIFNMSDLLQTSYTKITKWYNSCHTDLSVPIFRSNMYCLMDKMRPNFEQNLLLRLYGTSCNTEHVAPIFLPNMHCRMVKVWYKFEQNQVKFSSVKRKILKYGRNNRSISPNTTICAGMIIITLCRTLYVKMVLIPHMQIR